MLHFLVYTRIQSRSWAPVESALISLIIGGHFWVMLIKKKPAIWTWYTQFSYSCSKIKPHWKYENEHAPIFRKVLPCELKLHRSCLCVKGSEVLPVPPTCFNHTDVRIQWELVKPLWLFSSGALRLSLPWRWHCPASHQLNYPWNILPHVPSDDALCWEWLSGCAFQRRIKIQGCEGEKAPYVRPLFIFALLVVFVFN